MNKESIFYLFVALVTVVIIVLVNADKIWDKFDNHVVPLVSEEEEEFVSTAGAGSADAKWITCINVNWDRGNVYVRYANQQRLTWKEIFTQGGPSQYNTMHYWMNTHTLFIDYRSQEWLDKDKKANWNISKDLHIIVPQGIVLEQIIINNQSGHIVCEVEAKEKELR